MMVSSLWHPLENKAHQKSRNRAELTATATVSGSARFGLGSLINWIRKVEKVVPAWHKKEIN